MKFEGVYTALITPFQNNGKEIDYGAFKEIIERQIHSGVAGIVPCGTTGESPTLLHNEHRDLIRKSVKFVNGRISIIAGTGSNSTAEAIELTISACKDGVDAVMLVNPYYNKPSQLGLYEHFKSIAASSSVPVVIYNIKGRTAVNVEVETFKKLANIENIKAVKEASGDMGQMISIYKSCGESLCILSGDDNIIPAVMGIGGRGVISVMSNLYPAKMVKIMGHYLAGNFPAGNRLFYDIHDLITALFWETNPVGVKAAAEIMGLCSGTLRLPMLELDKEKKGLLSDLISAMGADT